MRHSNILQSIRMSRFSWRTQHSPKSFLQILYQPHFLHMGATEPPLHRKNFNGAFLAFQKLLQHRTLHNCDSVRSRADFSTSRLLLLKRFIHATGSRYSIERDYYEILGVSKDASRDDIKKAFHALAKKYHPDANKNNASAKRKFQEIRDAYETLQDPKKRGQYDKMNERLRSSEGVEYDAWNAQGSRYDYQNNFSDSFQNFFSEIFESGTEKSAANVQVELSLSFSEAVQGCTKHLSFNAYIPCGSCDGQGHPTNAKRKVCPTCEGFGRVTIPPFTATCSMCKGVGHIIKEYCRTCRGSGVVEAVKEVKVTIPAGVDSGDVITVQRGGNAGGRGVHPGNLFINLKVAKDPAFARDGADIYVDAHISFTQAILGGKVEVLTLFGKTQVKIPKGVQSGQLIALRGKGLPKKGFFVDHGDQYVRFCINFPTEVNERQRVILEEFEREEIERQNGDSVDGNWWQHILEHVTAPKFMLEISLFMLIILLLNKALG